MKNFIKLLSIISILIMLVGCGGNEVTSISLNGSTSMEKLANSLSEVYMEQNPNVIVTTEFTGSGAGIQAVSNGTSNIGNSSRYLKEDELALGLVENVIAIDALGVIVDNNNIIDNLTTEQLIGIFTGTIRNWNEVGGNDQNIVVIGRESGSGTRDAFEEILNLKDIANYAQEIDSTGAVVAKVASIPGAIGYVSLNVIDEKVKAVSVNGTEPTEENILSGDYNLFRPFIMVTKGSIEDQSAEVIEFFNFIKSDLGNQVIKLVGLIPSN